MATWTTTITPHGPVANMLVDISSVRTDGEETITVSLQGVRVENVNAALRDQIAAKLKVLATQQAADAVAEDTLTGWATQLDTALNALET